MNRPLAFGPDGGVVLRPDRVYRVLLVVTGETTAEDLEDALVAAGFERPGLCTSTPRAWPHDRPRDWPEEPRVDTADSECVVRASGRFGAEPRAFSRDMAIDGSEATYTVAAGWDYSPSLTDRRAPGPELTGADKPSGSDPRGVALVATAAALFGWGVWTNIRSERRIQRETQRMRAAVERDEREAIERRVKELVRDGHSQKDALALAQEERADTELPSLEAFGELAP
jgi:hypothetical protein